MELSPQSVAHTSFKTVKKGYDPGEVRAYLESLSKSIESLQSQATAMEARARAAVARLQEIASQPAQAPPPPTAPLAPAPTLDVRPDESETISRTLLLAQRTADTTIAEAQAEADRIIGGADDEKLRLVSDAQATADRLIEDAKDEARRSGETERIELENEVQTLLERREHLLGDVEQLESHVADQRDRLLGVASALTDMANKAPDGLGDIERPVLSAAADEPADLEAEEDSSADLAGTSATPTVSSYDSVPEPVLDALESSSAVSGLDSGGDSSADAESGDETTATESLTPLPNAYSPGWPGPTPAWNGGASTTAGSETDSETPSNSGGAAGTPAPADRTPPSGQSNQFLFEDITGDVPVVSPLPAPSPPTASGEGDAGTGGERSY